LDTPPSTRTAADVRGAATGALILSGFGAAWALLALKSLAAPPALPLAVASVVALVLVVLSVRRIVTAGRLPRGNDAEMARRGRNTGIAFGVIFTLEGALIALGAVLLARARQPLWIPPMAALVVGLHFLPLARVFGVPLYYWTGGATVAWALLASAIPEPVARLLLLGLGVGIILWVTASVILYRVR
jgi:hypothetical protein